MPHGQDADGAIGIFTPDAVPARYARLRSLLLTWAAMQIYQKDKDLRFLQEIYEPLCAPEPLVVYSSGSKWQRLVRMGGWGRKRHG